MSSLPPDLLVVTGLQREAQIAAGDGVMTVCSGGSRSVLSQWLAGVEPPRGGVLSFGLAGGLSPDLRSGDLVLGSHVLEQSERHDVHGDWHSAILSASESTMRVRHGGITGHDVVVARAADKAALYAGSGGALAVDMESHIAALYARKHGLPFAIIRVISDPVTRSLPPIASDALKPDGNIDMPKVLKGIARNPGQLPALIAAGFDSGRAFASLRRVRGLLGPLFGLRLPHL
jgi:hopanoid-associated phosphorylase